MVDQTFHAAVALGGLKTGLVSFWEFENTSWTDAVVASGNNLTDDFGTNSTSVSGKVGNCLSVNGGNLSHVSNASLDFSNGFSVATWVNDSSLSSRGICRKANEMRVQVGSAGTGTVRVLLEDGGSTPFLDSVATLTASTWGYVVAVWDKAGGLLKISVNGGTFFTGSDSSTTFSHSGDSFTVGLALDRIDLLDQMGFWNRALTQTEVTQLYNGGSGLTYAAM